MDSFRLLLNEISHELTEQDLQSLIHIYNVPGGVRKQINGGLALFNYMITQDFISREKIGNLHTLIRKIRPPRKDLVRLVDKYVQKEFQTDDVRTVITDISESSWEQVPEIKRGSPVIVSQEETVVCNIDCAWAVFRCRRVPSCYTPIMVLLLFAIIATAVFWYADVPEISNAINSNSDLKSAGVYILVLEILALLLVTGLRIRGKLTLCLACRKPGYAVLANPIASIQEGPSRPVVSSTSTGRLERVASAPRKYKISQSSESAVFSSYTSGEPGSMSTVGTMNEPMNEPPVNSEPEA